MFMLVVMLIIMMIVVMLIIMMLITKYNCCISGAELVDSVLDVVRKESESCDCLQVTRNLEEFVFPKLFLMLLLFVIVVFVAFDGFKECKRYEGSTFSFVKKNSFIDFFPSRASS